MMKPSERRVEILLVEDNPADVKLWQECLSAVPFPTHLSSVSDSEAALAFLERRTPYTEAPTPDLILLDIHLPTGSGWKVLGWLRAIPFLTSIPVVMLTGLPSPADEEQRDRLQPDYYLVKPTTLEEWQRVGEVLEELMRKKSAAV
jgi:chemotaxis family two-component system response regulator Rcp1